LRTGRPELDQYAAHAPRLRVVILSERADHRGLALLEAIERSLHALDGAADPGGSIGKKARARIDRRAVRRNDRASLVVNRFG